MERVSDECLSVVKDVLERRRANGKKTVLPIPCTKGYEEWTVKDWFQKVNKELDELKETVLTRISGMNMNMCDTMSITRQQMHKEIG